MDSSGVVVKGFLHNSLQKQVEECWGEYTTLSNANGHLEELTQLIV